MLNKFFDWLQYGWGVGSASYDDTASYSKLLEGSLNFWGLLEGTHLLTLMLFFGTILIVDLRMLGVLFREYPLSVVEKRVLPMTITAMIIVLVTGVILFVAKSEVYWHNLMFRTKMVLLFVAMANIAIFHRMIEKNKAEWDAAPSPPSKVRLSAIISLTSWVLIIACGRFIAYNWFDCGKAQADWINTVQDCAGSKKGALSLNQQAAQGGEQHQ